MQEWEDATAGKVNFVRNITAPELAIVNIGTGDLAALGSTSGPGGILALGGGIYTHDVDHTITRGIAWQDFAENWDEGIGNGNPPGTFDYFTVVAQEVGHAIGLGHTNDIPGPDLMDGSYSGEQTAASVNDIAHIQSVYGVGGMRVVSSSPADGEVISTQPTNFVIDFSDPYDLTTVDPSDLTVNGIAADSVVPTDTDTLTFQYNTTPVTTQGLQTISIAASAIERDGSGVGSPLLVPFNASFRFDAVVMEVVSIDPPDGSLVELPFTTLTVNFNEAYGQASVGTDDLVLSQGSVTGFNFVDADTVEYTLGGILNEGPFTVSMADGSVTDAFGNFGTGFSASYTLDFGVFPYPVPLVPKQPLGSLIYDPSISGTIDPGGDTDSFAISVDPGQTITVVVTSDGVGTQLYGGSRNGSLFTIDVASGTGTLVGLLPIATTEIEHDNLTGRSFAQASDGFFSGLEFDIDTGAGIGGLISNGAAFNGLEYVAGTLFGTAITGPGGPSTLRTLDPFTGASVIIGATGVGPVSGLAYDDSAGIMYGIAGGPGPANLYTIDLGSGAATLVGTTSFQAGSLEFGPDGALYGGGTGPSSGQLFRIDPATGASTFVGATGFSLVTGLTLREGDLLHATVELARLDDGVLLDSATAAVPGEDAVIQTASTVGQLGQLGPGPRT